MQTQPLERVDMAIPPEAIATEKDLLAQWGFTVDEIVSLLWLRQWYQSGGSDRAATVRYLEFLRLLVQSGELEL
jgi:hypothetical protein